MSKNNKFPEIRFPEFTDSWEQCKFAELYKVNRERNENLIGYDKTISIATMSYKNEGNGASDESLRTYKVLRLGDLAFEGHTNKNFKYGRFVLNDIGEGIMSPRFSTLRPLNDMPISFWKHYIHYEPIMKYRLVNSTKAGTMMNELVPKDFFEQKILVPSKEEQEKIGSYFTNLDNLISLHQRESEKFEALKKTMLQKMFPRNGQNVPEIRFPGFTDAWEQRKLIDIATFSKGNGYSKGDLKEQGTPIILYGRLYTQYETTIREVDTFVEEKENSVFSKGGEVIIPASGETAEDISRASVVEKSGVLLGGDLNIVNLNNEYNPQFLAVSVSSGKSQKELSKKAQGKSVVHIRNSDIQSLNIPFPKLEEQLKISAYLSNLDNLISLHQREREMLEKLKKTMLQKMFPRG